MRFFQITRIKVLFTLLLMMLLSNGFALAQKEGDIQFMAQADYELSELYLMWFMNDPAQTPVEVEVFVQKGVFYDISEMSNAEQFAKLTKDNWTAERGMYQAVVGHNYTSGYYTFYLSVTLSDGTVQKSNTSPVSFSSVEPDRFLEFTSTPIEKATVGTEYNYTAVAFDPEDVDAEIEYYLISGPANMQIDQTTGKLTWTPEKKGSFEIWIQAISKNDPDVYGEQYFYITVFSCKIPAIISGNITDKDNNPVTSGYIQLFPTDFMEKPDNEWQAYAVVENGKYSLEADEGAYYMVFQDMYGYYQFYKDATDIEKAELLKVNCEQNLKIDMKLTNYKNPILYTVKGKVTDEDGNPLSYISVYFEGLIEDNNQGRNAFFYGFTDEDGNYEVQMPDAYTYIAYVDTYWDPVTGISKTLYYNQTYKRTEAEKLVLTGDLDNINFVIGKQQEFKYYTVSGNVSKEDGSPVENASVVFEGLYNAAGEKSPYYGNGAITDAQGNYSLQLPELFEYKAYVVTKNSYLYQPLYYKQTYNYEEAEVISLTADRTGIDFVISEPDFKMFKVSGTVSREDGTPIAGATVIFDGFNDDPGFYYNRWGESVATDKDGKYEIELPEIFKYIAYAFDASLYDRYKCQTPLYYNQTYNPDQATVLELKEDLTGIDFTFGDSPDEYKSSITGKVVDEGGNPLEGIYLMAYNVDTPNDPSGGMYDGWATMSDQNGDFAFISMAPGHYVLLAVPRTLDNAPGFYKEGSTVVMSWEEATVIEVKENEKVSDIEVILGIMGEAKNSDLGLCQITGSVKAVSNINQEKSAVSGAVIYIQNSEGKIQKYATTSNDGSFNLKNLPTGNLILKVEKLGYQTFTKNLKFDETQNYNAGEILLTPEPLKVNDGKSGISSITSYPNPAKDKLNVSFESRTENVQISLINSVGKMVWTSPVKTVRGSNNITLDVSGFANGAYFVIIDNGTYSTANPVTIQR